MSKQTKKSSKIKLDHAAAKLFTKRLYQSLANEGWLRHAQGCPAGFGEEHHCRCGLDKLVYEHSLKGNFS